MLRNRLEKFDVEAFFAREVKAFADSLASLSSRIPVSGIAREDENLRELTDAIHRSRVDCRAAEAAIGDNPALLKEVQERFRAVIEPFFNQSWFMQRAKAKPRGYPGDYEMLTAIYNGRPKSDGFGGYLDLYFLKSDLARAVCARMTAIRKFLVREVMSRTTKTSILNVASGPGREYTSEFDGAVESVQLTCVDTDEAALEFLKSQVAETSEDMDLSCVCYNALKMTSPENNRRQFGSPDIIYSVGLCDYLPDRYLVRILDGWRQTAGEDGIVYVAFKDALRYHGAEYQWHVDWHFYERTEEDCRNLFAKAGYDVDRMEVHRDETGIIMNFIARTEALRGVRIDLPQRLSGPHFPTAGSNDVADRIEEADSVAAE